MLIRQNHKECDKIYLLLKFVNNFTPEKLKKLVSLYQAFCF